MRNGARRTSRGAARVGPAAARAEPGLARTLPARAYYQAHLRLPIDDDLAVYAAYWYRGYACNPAAIYEKARELAPDVRGVWVVRAGTGGALPAGRAHVVAGQPVVPPGSGAGEVLRQQRQLRRLHGQAPGQVHVQTHHGTPLKVMGIDQSDYPVGAADMDFAGLLRRVDRWDYS